MLWRFCMAMLKTKSIYAEPDPGDGVRVLVARFWPRGVQKHTVGEWRRELAPSAALLKRYRGMGVSWREFVASYKAEIDTVEGRRAMAELRSQAETHNVTLLCYERDGAPCHRHVLHDVIHDPEKLHTAFEPVCSDRRSDEMRHNIMNIDMYDEMKSVIDDVRFELDDERC